MNALGSSPHGAPWYKSRWGRGARAHAPKGPLEPRPLATAILALLALLEPGS